MRPNKHNPILCPCRRPGRASVRPARLNGRVVVSSRAINRLATSEKATNSDARLVAPPSALPSSPLISIDDDNSTSRMRAFRSKHPPWSFYSSRASERAPFRRRRGTRKERPRACPPPARSKRCVAVDRAFSEGERGAQSSDPDQHFAHQTRYLQGRREVDNSCSCASAALVEL